MAKPNYYRHLGPAHGKACKGSSQADTVVDPARLAKAVSSRVPCWKCNPNGQNEVGFMRRDSEVCNNPACSRSSIE